MLLGHNFSSKIVSNNQCLADVININQCQDPCHRRHFYITVRHMGIRYYVNFKLALSDLMIIRLQKSYVLSLDISVAYIVV